MEVYVEGEISRPTYHTSGHLYFSLKDEGSVLKCVMFRSYASRLDFKLEEGKRVIAEGRIGVYKPRGEYQLYVTSLLSSGAGELALAFEKLKKSLEQKGYFDRKFKKNIPKSIESIALVTSKTGAALQDMLKIIDKRWPLVKVYVVNCQVQGKEAAKDIAESIKIADSLGVDVIVIGRGGGSLEDLWAFNEEIVAEAIFEASTPLVSAVGHEIDFLISDMVADLRAPTPSAAMEMILPDKDEKLLFIDTLVERINETMKNFLYQKERELRHIFLSYEQNSPKNRLIFYLKETNELKKRLKEALFFYLQRKEGIPKEIEDDIKQTIKNIIFYKKNMLENLADRFEAIIEAKKVKKGFAQVVKNGKPIELESLNMGDVFELQSDKVKVEAKVLGKKRLS